MSATPWRGTLIFAGTVAAVAAAAAVRFSGAEVVAAAEGAATGPVPIGSASVAGSSTAPSVVGGAAGGSAATSSAAEPSASSGAPGGESPAASASATPSASPAATQDVTIVGSTVQTRYGPLQLSVTFAGADITAVEALQAPSWHGESVQINAYAIPILNREAVAADSAGIDAVTGATVTSGAYRQSLQSAIDQHG